MVFVRVAAIDVIVCPWRLLARHGIRKSQFDGAGQ
jgi:hypothetical protein